MFVNTKLLLRNERITTYTRYTKQGESEHFTLYFNYQTVWTQGSMTLRELHFKQIYRKKRACERKRKKKTRSLFNYRQCLKMSTIRYGNKVRNKM